MVSATGKTKLLSVSRIRFRFSTSASGRVDSLVAPDWLPKLVLPSRSEVDNGSLIPLMFLTLRP
jgi:hypothetical protein